MALEFAQACYLVGEFKLAETLYQELDEVLTSEPHLLRLASIRAKQYHHQGHYQKSVEQAYQALRLLGIDLPESDDALLALFAQEQASIDDFLKHKPLEAIYEQATVDDPDFHLTLELLFDMFGDSYLLGRGSLLAAIAATSARLSIERGNCAATSAGFINYATILCSSGDYIEGHQFGRLAVKLADKYQNPTFKNYTYHVFSLGINHWQAPLGSSYHYWHEASKLSKESGSPYAGWVFLQLPHLLFASGSQLQKVEKQVEESFSYFNANRLSDMAKLLNIIVKQPLRHLTGKTNTFTSLDDDQFSTQDTLDSFKDAPFFLGHTIYSVLRATLLCREFVSSEKLLEWLPIIENTVQAQIILVDSYLYTGLQLAARYNDLPEADKAKQLEAINNIEGKFENWATLCPANYQHKHLMLKAEVLRLSNDPMAALEHYEQARDAALESRFLMDAALSDELAGFFWLELGRSHQASIYLNRALSGYQQWGADGKVTWLKTQFPHYLTEDDRHAIKLNTTISSTVGVEDFSANLDMGSVVKASQAVSQHIHLDSLTEELLNLAVENAGATRGVLLLESQGDFIVAHTVNADTEMHAEAKQAQQSNVEYSQSHSLSHAIVRYVINIGKPVVYTPNNHADQFDRCPYLANQTAISVLCLPIIRQNKMSGILYLENNHMADAFQLDRVQTLKIIASQAAISLENAQMYHDLQAMNKNLEELVNERTNSLFQANRQLKETNRELYILSTTDRLTGLYNRRYIEEQLGHALENKQHSLEPVSILMLDIDHFKAINDTFGHNMGDRVLVNVSNAISHTIQPADIAGRWGGEEFIILCPTGIDSAKKNADRISTQIASLDLLETGNITVSVGVTSCLKQDTIDSVLNRVDQALYQAKHNGRNQVIIKIKEDS